MALSIDVVTFYTARSEAQLAADASALAAARVLANSGVTSNSTTSSAEVLATKVAKEVARGNSIGGANINPATDMTVTFNTGAANFDTDPHVTVTVTRTDLPAFFARILGTQQVTVSASATAEAYNPSSPLAGALRNGPPVAPLCVKPWLLPNLDPTQASGTTPIFDPANGAINSAALVGQEWPSPNPALNQNGLYALCEDCSGTIPVPSPGGYYPGAIDAADFPSPTQLPTCAAGFDLYQSAIAGCVQKPISCGSTLPINIDVSTTYAVNRNANAVAAARCLIHYTAPGDSDSIDTPITPPFQFVAGTQNPFTGAGDDVMVSDSLVTIPVIDTTASAPTNPVQVIGFLQVFLNPSPTGAVPSTGPASANEIPATVVNIAGCGTAATGVTPIIGNGASPVAVRLISPP